MRHKHVPLTAWSAFFLNHNWNTSTLRLLWNPGYPLFFLGFAPNSRAPIVRSRRRDHIYAVQLRHKQVPLTAWSVLEELQFVSRSNHTLSFLPLVLGSSFCFEQPLFIPLHLHQPRSPQTMPLPKGVVRHRKKFRAQLKIAGKPVQGPSRETVDRAHKDLILLQAGFSSESLAYPSPHLDSKDS